MTPLVFDIQKFSVNDGPGIRTTVFLKGCPLHCIWCHNPESQKTEREFFFEAKKCIFCQQCGRVCPKHCHTFENKVHSIDRAKCIHCGKCTEVCFPGALEEVGKCMSVGEIVAEVRKDKIFYDNSGGGVTLSGGEPMLFPEFSSDLLRMCKEEEIHTAIETSGFCAEKYLFEILPYTDLFLYDIKAVNQEKHKKFTGVDNSPILANLHRLDEAGAAFILRCPLIPGLNDSEADLEALAELANSLKNIRQIDLEPYHPLGENKHMLLGRNPTCKASMVPIAQADAWIQFLRLHTAVSVRKG
ncbi:MAG: Benzylsuccinate synthase activating enzyme [Lentisphaerae bacterium ADurb.Bin242]|nr:MAG: Benzylsuccinate synthase activating enzyme [Lentisphaerae bacterium ADurb.Bin242]